MNASIQAGTTAAVSVAKAVTGPLWVAGSMVGFAVSASLALARETHERLRAGTGSGFLRNHAGPSPRALDELGDRVMDALSMGERKYGGMTQPRAIRSVEQQGSEFVFKGKPLEGAAAASRPDAACPDGLHRYNRHARDHVNPPEDQMIHPRDAQGVADTRFVCLPDGSGRVQGADTRHPQGGWSGFVRTGERAGTDEPLAADGLVRVALDVADEVARPTM